MQYLQVRLKMKREVFHVSTGEAILNILSGKSDECRWFVLSMIRNSSPSPYNLSPEGKLEVDEVLVLLRELLSSRCDEIA